MVNETFISQIESLSNGQLPAYDLPALDKVCKDYPCFQSAFLLKAVYLKQENEAVFEEHLPGIAIRVLSRSVLYDRVHGQITTPVAIPDKVEVQDAEEEIIDAELNDLLAKADILQAEEVETTDAPIEVEPIQEENDNLKALVDEINKKRKLNPIISKTPKEKIKKTIKETAKAPNTKPKKKKIVKQEVVEALSSQINSFTDWLKHKKSISKVEPLVPIDITASHEAELMIEVKKSNLKLEDFLVNQIERKQIRKEVDKGGFKHAVSETYAVILVNQGKIQDAINVYKELSIKYPKKSSSFARQIENLKNSL